MLSNGTIISQNDLQERYNFVMVNFLDYFEMRRKVSSFLKRIDYTESLRYIRPHFPHQFSVFMLNKKGCKDIYTLVNKNTISESNFKIKWSQELETIMENHIWTKIFKTCFYTVKHNQLIWFQFRILHRILGTNKLLHQIAIKTPQCVPFVSQ